MAKTKRCEYLYEAIGGTRAKPFGHIGTFLTKAEAMSEAHRSGRPNAHVERYCGPREIVRLMRDGFSYREAIRKAAGLSIHP